MIESHEIILYGIQPVILKLKRYTTEEWKKHTKIKQTFASCSLEVAIDSTVSFLFFAGGPISITTDDNDSNNEHKSNFLCLCVQ